MIWKVELLVSPQQQHNNNNHDIAQIYNELSHATSAKNVTFSAYFSFFLKLRFLRRGKITVLFAVHWIGIDWRTSHDLSFFCVSAV